MRDLSRNLLKGLRHEDLADFWPKPVLKLLLRTNSHAQEKINSEFLRESANHNQCSEIVIGTHLMQICLLAFQSDTKIWGHAAWF